MQTSSAPANLRHLTMGPIVASLALLLVLGAGSAIESRSIGQRNERDPMLALPSGADQVHYVRVQDDDQHQQQVRPQKPEGVTYVVEQQQQQQQHNHHHHQARPVGQVEVIEYHQEQADPQQQQQQAGPEQGGHEQLPRGEYPGEIIYVDQNGQLVNPVQAAATPGGLARMAGSLGQNSALAATILTEVPVKDMPDEVLNKLKREFGVKVVATREHPGANLVINCDEHSASPDSSVCAKQQPLALPLTNDYESQRISHQSQTHEQHQHLHLHRHQPTLGYEYSKAPDAQSSRALLHPLTEQAQGDHGTVSVHSEEHQPHDEHHHDNHELHVPTAQAGPSPAYVSSSHEAHGDSAESGDHTPTGLSYRNIEAASHGPYQHQNQATTAAVAATPETGAQEDQTAAHGESPNPHAEYYNSRGSSPAPEQPTETSDGASHHMIQPDHSSENASAQEQQQQHQQYHQYYHEQQLQRPTETQAAGPGPIRENLDQNVGFDEQPNSG